MKEPPPTRVLNDKEIAQILRTLDTLVKTVEEVLGRHARTHALTKEAPQRGNPH